MTISIQLSEPHDYLGGRLELFDAARSVVPDVRGSVAVFPSFVYHRVTPIRRGERRALVAWMGGPSLR